MARVLVYDGSFAGWLSAVFHSYEHKCTAVEIVPASSAQHGLFADTWQIPTEEEKSLRVWKGLRQRLSPNAVKALYRAFLSEEKGMENRLLQYVQYIFANNPTSNAESNYAHPAVSYVMTTAKKVYREKHRMEAFVRFQKQSDGLYVATIDPDFNVLPLINQHFQQRYADQRWLIYDTRRKTGLYYDGIQTQSITLSIEPATSPDPSSNPSPDSMQLDESDPYYRQLWQQYFSSVNIAARKNTKLHIRHMPLRYWKYLPEKHPHLPEKNPRRT